MCLKAVSVFFILFFLHESLHAQNASFSLKEIDSVFLELKNHLEEAEISQDPLKISLTHIHLADIYKNLGIANEAIEHYHQAIEVYKENDTILVYVENNIGAVHLSLKQYDIAEEYLQKSLSLAKKINDKKGEATSYALLGSVAEKKSYYPAALNYQEQSLVIFQHLLDSTGLAVTYENMGSIYEDLEDYEEAYEYFHKAQEFAVNSPLNLQINILNNLGDANRKNGNLETALQYTEQAISMAKSSNNIHQEASALRDLAKTYSCLDNYKLSYHYMEVHKQVEELEIERKNTELVSTLQILYKVKERESELKLLSKQNELNKIKQTIILLFSVFVVLALIGWILYYKKKKQQESKIHHFKQQLLKADLDKKTSEEAALQREVSIKTSALTNYSLNLAHKNKMLTDISNRLFNLKDRNVAMIKPKLEALVKEIEFDLAKEQEWTEFIGFFEQIHPDFFQNLKKITTTELSPAELRLCMLLKLNLSSKEIASILRITPDSVRIARYRLRKKLEINPNDDLQALLLNL